MLPVSPEQELQTERLILEPLVPGHAQILHPHTLEPSLYTFVPSDGPRSVEVLDRRYRALANRTSPDGSEVWLNWAMRLSKSDVYLGMLEATIHDNATAFLAYTVFKPHWRRGYAKEGCQKVLSHVIDAYFVDTFYADVDTQNVASISLLESLGFLRVRFTKNADFFKGRSSHEYRYRLNCGKIIGYTRP